MSHNVLGVRYWCQTGVPLSSRKSVSGQKVFDAERFLRANPFLGSVTEGPGPQVAVLPPPMVGWF
jgi:hypothetical protein